MTKQKKNKFEILTALENIHGPIPELKAADIIFIRHNKSIMRRFLRKIIGSYWDHSALVLYPRDVVSNRTKTIIIEAKKPAFLSIIPMRGVAIHQLDKYTANPKAYDIGIGRVHGLSEQQRERVVTFMLMNVDAPYWPWTHWLLLPGYFFKFAARYYLNQQRFSCSGLIQKAFYDAMDWDDKQQVIFKSGMWSPIELQELTNPADIADSENIEWVYNER
ncbi:MAG: hypothetical protein Q8P90_05425 [bacterium]|nr:hypothetical protein [bacterium]